jgi:threonine dehydrogenase-like Zn-dependent dehydrogenase
MQIPSTHRVARISTHGNIDVAEVPLPQPGPGEVLVRVMCSLISPGTELQGLRNPKKDGEEAWREFGYQNAGVIVDANGCTQFKEGDRVGCMGGGYAQHSDWAVVPQHLTFRLPDAISFEEAACSNLLGTAVHAVHRATVQFGEHVAVVGLGIVGQLISQVATLSGAHVVGIDRVAMRQQVALQLGAEAVAEFSDDVAGWQGKYTRGYGLDAGFVAFGGDASEVLTRLALAMKHSPDSHAYGRIVVVGGAQANIRFPAIFGNVDIRSSSRTGPGYHDKEWERGGHYPEALVPWNTRRNVEECYHFIEMKKLRVEPLITHRISLDEVSSVCRQMMQHPDEVLGAIVKYE